MRWDSKTAAKLEVSLPLAPGVPLFGGYPDPLKETLGMGLPGVSEAAGFFEPPEPEAKGYQSLREAQGQGAAFSPRFNLVYEYQSLREAQGLGAAAERSPVP